MKKTLTILCLFISSVFLFAEIQLYYEPVFSLPLGNELSVKLQIRSDPEQIEEVRLFYRESGDLTYQEIELEMGSVSETVYTFTIEDARNYKSAAEFFFQVLGKDGQIYTLPEMGAESAPYVVGVAQPQVVDESGFVLLSPDRDFSDLTSEYVIAVSFFAIQNTIDPSTIRFFYNGKDMTEKAEIYSNMLVYKVKRSEGGVNKYQVMAKLKSGQEIASEMWKTTVSSSGLKQVLNLRGRTVFNSYLASQSYAEADSLDSDDKRANWLLEAEGKYNWLGFGSKIYLSSLEDHNKQAVNRYNISLTSPYFDITAGDYTPNYGTFLMSGKNVQGIHARLHTDQFQLKVTSGKSRRLIEGNLSANRGSTFQQNSLSIRTEVGNSAFMWGFGFTKNKDDMTSLDEDLYFTAGGDTLKPQDNIIFGTDVMLSLFKRRLMWGAEAAMSYYNSDISDGAMSLDEINEEFDVDIDLPLDPKDFENIFVANQFMQPFKPGMTNLAYKTYLRLFLYHNFISFSYSAVGGSFNSLSSNSLQKDTSTLSINDNISLFKNRLFLNLGMNLTSDNLNDEKESTTTSLSYNAAVQYRPTSISFVRLGLNSSETTRDGDTAGLNELDIVSSSINVGAGYLVDQISPAPTQFTISYNKTGSEDLAGAAFENNRDNFILSANSNFVDLPLETVVSYSLALDEQQTSETTYNSLYLKGTMNFMNDKLKPYLDLQLTSNSGDNEYSTTLFNIGTSYYPLVNTFLSTNIGGKFYADSSDDSKDNTLFSWRLKITQKF